MPEPKFDVTTVGEMLVRLSVSPGERLETARQLDVHPAGSEANVVSLLARLNRRTLWAGALPANPLGRLAANSLRTAGVSLDGILWRENGRMGLYYEEFGAPPRGTQVTYDRAYSCAAGIQSEEIDWERLLDTRILHLTGITPALSQCMSSGYRRRIAESKAARCVHQFRSELPPEVGGGCACRRCLVRHPAGELSPGPTLWSYSASHGTEPTRGAGHHH